METEDSLPQPWVPATCLYPEPDPQFIPPKLTSWRSIARFSLNSFYLTMVGVEAFGYYFTKNVISAASKFSLN